MYNARNRFDKFERFQWDNELLREMFSAIHHGGH